MTKILIGRSDVDLDYPVCRPSLDLDFTQEELDPRITFTRGSTGTRVNRNRLIETIDANQPRFDYDPVTGECKGLLIEESRQNLLTYSADVSNAAWGGKSTVIIGSTITSPDGTNTAYKVIENTSNVIHNVNQSVGTISGTYTVSCFVKAGERYRGYIQLFGAGGNSAAQFNLRTGTITGGAGTNTITPYPNGWYRVTSTLTFTSATAACYFAIFNDNGVSTYTGDGNSGIYVWGLQVEAGAFPTSYIPTTASTVTRSADLASMTGTNFSSWYNQREGSIYLSAIPYYSSSVNAFNRLISINDNSGTQNSVIQILTSNTTNAISNSFYINSAYLGGNNKTIFSGTKFKLASSFSSSNISICFDGSSLASNKRPSFTLPTFDRMSIGSYNNNLICTMHLSRLTYYPRRLKDNQLVLLTQ